MPLFIIILDVSKSLKFFQVPKSKTTSRKQLSGQCHVTHATSPNQQVHNHPLPHSHTPPSSCLPATTSTAVQPHSTTTLSKPQAPARDSELPLPVMDSIFSPRYGLFPTAQHLHPVTCSSTYCSFFFSQELEQSLVWDLWQLYRTRRTATVHEPRCSGAHYIFTPHSRHSFCSFVYMPQSSDHLQCILLSTLFFPCTE